MTRELDFNPRDPWSDTYCPTDVACDPWPMWLEGFREHQLDAVELVLDGYKRGKKVMVLDAPVGAGKTLIAEMVRRRLGLTMLYVAHTRGLQGQFCRDFEYAKLLKGRGNYPTTKLPYPDFSASDCKGPRCVMCEGGYAGCPYQQARAAAKGGNVAVVNTAYMLTEGQRRGAVCADREFVCVDECDTLEGILLGQLEFKARGDGLYGLDAPKKGSHGKTIADWLEHDWQPAALAEVSRLAGLADSAVGDKQAAKYARQKKQLAERMARAKRAARGMREGGWVRDYEGRDEDASLVLKPVYVDWAAQEKVWGLGERWLCMSGTVIDAQTWAEGLGLERDEWECVSVEMTFPAENRPVVCVPLGKMDRKHQDAEKAAVMRGVGVVCDRHRDENVLIHTVSYQLARDVLETVKGAGIWPGSRIHFYTHPSERDATLERFKDRGGVLIGPSLDRGVDLPGDLCRVQIIVKVPYPNLGDRRVGERMRGEGGQRWYATETARTMVQMTGRGVRSSEDWCVSYVLDAQFLAWWNREGKRLIPEWWNDAFQVGRVREYQ